MLPVLQGQEYDTTTEGLYCHSAGNSYLQPMALMGNLSRNAHQRRQSVVHAYIPFNLLTFYRIAVLQYIALPSGKLT